MERLFKIHASQCWKIMSNGKGGNLSVTCQTFLKEWYADDREQIHSKYIDKGNLKETDAIDFAAKVLGYGVAEKNELTIQNEYMVGTCDVETHDSIIDVKCPWNKKTFLDNTEELDTNYEWQGRVYMSLYQKDKFILFYGLMDTPEMDWVEEVIYEDLPESDRWLAYQVDRDAVLEDAITERVIKCREWLDNYDTFVKSKVGRINHLM